MLSNVIRWMIGLPSPDPRQEQPRTPGQLLGCYPDQLQEGRCQENTDRVHSAVTKDRLRGQQYTSRCLDEQ
jgi:hypothetical protein